MARNKKVSQKQIDFMMKSKETDTVCARNLGLSPKTVNNYRNSLCYDIDHSGNNCAIQKKLVMAKIDKTNPIDKYLYG